MFKSGSSFSAWWLCSKCDYEWTTTIYARSKGIGCKKCSVKNRSGANNSGARKIYQYTKDGVFVKEWGAIIEAARSENINPANMAMCANGKRSIAGGYRWSFEYFEKLPPIYREHKSRKGLNGKPVIQVDLQGNVLNHFVSLYDAEEKTGVNATSISKVINGHVKMAGGYVWKVEKHE